MATPEKEEIYYQIGDRIRQYREQTGMSQQALADEVGFQSGTAISLIESGDRRVSVGDLKLIAEALDVPMPILLGEEEPKPNIKVALRSDGDLTPKDRDEVLGFYKYVKEKAKKRGGDN